MGRLSWSKKLEVASTQFTLSLRGCEFDRAAKVVAFRARGRHVVNFTRPILEAGSCS